MACFAPEIRQPDRTSDTIKGMMTITLRFYAELNDRLPPDRRKVDFQISLQKDQSIADLIESLNIPLSDVDRVLANGQPVDVSYRVQEGDRFSVYPEFRSLNRL